MNSRDYVENAVRNMSAQQYAGAHGHVSGAQVASLNPQIEPTLHDLIQRMDDSNGRTIERAEMAERIADLLCGERPVSDENEATAKPPMSLLLRIECAIDHGEQVGDRIDSALHRILRRLTPNKLDGA